MAVCLTAVVSLSVSAQVDADRTRLFKYLMGTSVRVEAYGADAARRQEAADEAFAAIAEVDRIMSDYRQDSELAHVNATAAAGPVVVSAPLFAVLTAAQKVNAATRNAFSPVTTGAAVDDALRLDAANRTVVYMRPDVRLTLAGLGKGFAAEVAAGSLKRRGLAGAVDTSGVQYLIGLPPGKMAWSIGIGDPLRRGALLGAVDVPGGAVATATAPAPNSAALSVNGTVLSATVLSPDGTLADALSHALLKLGPQSGLALLQQFPDTWGIVATRRSDGAIATLVSPGHERHFHPVTR